MSVSPEEIARLAELAALRLEPDEVQRLQRELGDILDHVARVSAVPADDDVVPSGRVSTLRDDVPEPSRPDVPPAIAPAFAEGFFLVPKLDALGDDG